MGTQFPLFADSLITRMTLDLLPQGANVIYTRPLEGIILKLKISVIFGFVAALPYVGVLVYRNLKERTDILREVNIRKNSALKYAAASIILLSADITYNYYILRFTYYRKHIYVAFFVTGAAITPPDIFTQVDSSLL
ncbi:MAG: twin-arginine translocase subunit TatC [Archaeoglobaceae archaeon]